jgi:hypothetical protein
VAALGSLSEDAFADLLSFIQRGASADTASDIATQMEKELPSLRGHDIQKVVTAVDSLQGIQKYAHVTPETFSTDIAEALFADAPKLAKGVDAQSLKDRISKIVKAKAINITTEKINELQSEVERGYCKARILTDVRTAFSEDASALPTAMTVMHTLRIRYHDDAARHREFYVSMDEDDLGNLKRAIERAQTKSKTLEELLAKVNCRLFK